MVARFGATGTDSCRVIDRCGGVMLGLRVLTGSGLKICSGEGGP